MSCKKIVLKNFAKFKWKHLCWSLFLIKLQAFRLRSLFKRDSSRGVFPVNFAKLLRKTILQNIYERMLLEEEKLAKKLMEFPVLYEKSANEPNEKDVNVERVGKSGGRCRFYWRRWYYFTVSHRKTSNFAMCLLHVISLLFCIKDYLLFEINWSRFSLPKFCRCGITPSLL